MAKPGEQGRTEAYTQPTLPAQPCIKDIATAGGETLPNYGLWAVAYTYGQSRSHKNDVWAWMFFAKACNHFDPYVSFHDSAGGFVQWVTPNEFLKRVRDLSKTWKASIMVHGFGLDDEGKLMRVWRGGKNESDLVLPTAVGALCDRLGIALRAKTKKTVCNVATNENVQREAHVVSTRDPVPRPVFNSNDDDPANCIPPITQTAPATGAAYTLGTNGATVALYAAQSANGHWATMQSPAESFPLARTGICAKQAFSASSCHAVVLTAPPRHDNGGVDDMDGESECRRKRHKGAHGIAWRASSEAPSPVAGMSLVLDHGFHHSKVRGTAHHTAHKAQSDHPTRGSTEGLPESSDTEDDIGSISHCLARLTSRPENQSHAQLHRPHPVGRVNSQPMNGDVKEIGCRVLSDLPEKHVEQANQNMNGFFAPSSGTIGTEKATPVLALALPGTVRPCAKEEENGTEKDNERASGGLVTLLTRLENDSRSFAQSAALLRERHRGLLTALDGPLGDDDLAGMTHGVMKKAIRALQQQNIYLTAFVTQLEAEVAALRVDIGTASGQLEHARRELALRKRQLAALTGLKCPSPSPNDRSEHW